MKKLALYAMLMILSMGAFVESDGSYNKYGDAIRIRKGRLETVKVWTHSGILYFLESVNRDNLFCLLL